MIIYILKQLIKYNIHIGHYKWECDYRISYFLLGLRNSIHIINVYNSIYILKRILYVIYNLSLMNQRILIVNNINYNIKSLLQIFNKNKLWYINNKWTGGLLTNQKHIYLYNEDLFFKYYNLGYKSILPSFVFVSNLENTSSCLFEAIILNILNSTLFDTNLGFYGIFYKLYSNDDNFIIMNLFSKLLAKTYIKGLYDRKKIFIKKKERRKERKYYRIEKKKLKKKKLKERKLKKRKLKKKLVNLQKKINILKMEKKNFKKKKIKNTKKLKFKYIY